MTKTYRPWNPTQSFLLPQSPLEWLPEGHLALFILDVLRELDLKSIDEKYQTKDRRGTRKHNPWMMTALLLYAYCIGMPSSRRIERATYEDVAFRVIAGGAHPGHTRISEFRRENLQELAGLFVQVLLLCREAGLVKLLRRLRRQRDLAHPQEGRLTPPHGRAGPPPAPRPPS